LQALQKRTSTERPQEELQGMRGGNILTRGKPGTGLTLAVVLLAILGTGASRALADMVLSEVIVDLQSPDETRRDVEVWNSGEETLYLEIKLAQIIDPELPEPSRVALDDPRTAGLLATPNRLALGADERQRVRIVVRKPASERDLIYRVSFIPKENPADSESEMAFKVLVGYEVLVLVRPPKGRPDVKVTREGQQLSLRNEGNSSLLIRQMEQCPEDATECTAIAGNRLYAGETWELTLPHPGPVRVYQSYRSENSVKQY
jgi:P pilus assembly chaperone PapD